MPISFTFNTSTCHFHDLAYSIQPSRYSVPTHTPRRTKDSASLCLLLRLCTATKMSSNSEPESNQSMSSLPRPEPKLKVRDVVTNEQARYEDRSWSTSFPTEQAAHLSFAIDCCFYNEERGQWCYMGRMPHDHQHNPVGNLAFGPGNGNGKSLARSTLWAKSCK